MLNNRILLSSPCYGKVDPEILEDWMRLAYHCGRRMPEYDFFLGIKTKSEQFRARNVIVEAAQQYDCDRILMLDDDMVIDWNNQGHKAYDFLRKLIDHDKDIIGALYYQRGQECLPVLMKKLNDTGYRFLRDDEITGGLQEVDVAGGGCLLIKTAVFDKIPFPYFSPEYQYGTDVQLGKRAEEKGFKVWADTSIELGHLRDQKTVVTSKNRHQFQDTVVAQPGVKRTFVASEMHGALVRDAMTFTGRKSPDEVYADHEKFMNNRKTYELSDQDWYREYPMERVCRQAWFNTQNEQKKMMNQFIIGMIPHNKPMRVLDFGCGVGMIAHALAEKGHSVTAMDIRGTGTLEFLKWRVAKDNVPMNIIESEGGVPKINGMYDAIIAMDCIEHIKDWRKVIETLSEHLIPGGILFANNATMYDMSQPEHYDVHPREFIKACAEADLLPQTHISYIKMEVPVHA